MARTRKLRSIELRKGAAGRDTAYVGQSRVRVTDIARLYPQILDELIADRIVQSLPSLTREQVLEAIDYWREHKADIAAEIKEEERLLSKIPHAG